MHYRRRAQPPKERRLQARRRMRKGLRASIAKSCLDVERSLPAAEEFRILTEPAGAGYRHVLTPREIKRRLARLPEGLGLLRNLHTIILPRMTRKRRGMGCYGLCDFETGAVYLYPVEEGTEFEYGRLTSAQLIAYRKFGAKIRSTSRGWVVEWTERDLKRFYLDDVLIHEIGHTLDWWNGSTRQRERWAEYFADYWRRR